ncbi:hypothetical protein JCM16303_004035 [Sporobolomyces ruberrimus]
MADKRQAVVTALRGLAHSFGELSKAHRTAQSAIHEYSVEIEHSEQPATILNNFPALFGNLEAFDTTSTTGSKAKPASSSKSKATVATIAEEATEEDGKKKRGPAKEKKVKDPNAPKRPASAYIEYQNAVRDDFRERHNELPYSDVLKKIGESWASMTDEQKQPYNDIMERKKSTYLVSKKAYETEHGIVAPTPAPAAAASGEPKEYTGKKRGRKSNAERALIAAAAATEAGRGVSPSSAAAPASSSKQQADIPVDAPSTAKKAAEESDDDSEDSDDSEDDDSDDDDDSSEASEPTPPPVVVPAKKDKKAKGDKHKSKKSKTAA